MTMSMRKRRYCIPDHDRYLTRIKKSLYYTNLPQQESLSLPVTEFAAEVFSEHKNSLKRLNVSNAAKISRNASVSPCSLILALVYLERLKEKNMDYVSKINSSDLFLVSLMVSSKYLFDDGETDEVFLEEWAKAGAMSKPELVSLERQFLQAIEWEIYVDQLTFWNKLRALERHLAKKNGSSRGFFTYTEMLNASNDKQMYNLICCIASITAILATTYLIGVITLAGSFYISSCVPGSALYKRTNNIRLNGENVSLPTENMFGNEMYLDSTFLNYNHKVLSLKNQTNYSVNSLTDQMLPNVIKELVIGKRKLNYYCTLVPKYSTFYIV